MFCQKCGKEIPDGSKKCPFCETENKAKKSPKGCLLACIIIIAIFTLIAVISQSGNNDNQTETADATTTYIQQNDETSKKTEKTSATVSREFTNALKQAKSYSDNLHMSKKAIYHQLTSEYGGKFPADAAQYAIDNLQADYKYNALQQAKSYQNNLNMSKQAVYDQLVSEYGGKFTAEEAQYAVDNLPD